MLSQGRKHNPDSYFFYITPNNLKKATPIYKLAEDSARLCNACHRKDFADAVPGLRYLETLASEGQARALYNLYAADTKALKIDKVVGPQGALTGVYCNPIAEGVMGGDAAPAGAQQANFYKVSDLRAGAIKKSGGDILSLTMALNMALKRRSIAKKARAEELRDLKQEQQDKRQEMIDKWIKENKMDGMLRDEIICGEYVRKGRFNHCIDSDYEMWIDMELDTLFGRGTHLPFFLDRALREIAFFSSRSDNFAKVYPYLSLALTLTLTLTTSTSRPPAGSGFCLTALMPYTS